MEEMCKQKKQVNFNNMLHIFTQSSNVLYNLEITVDLQRHKMFSHMFLGLSKNDIVLYFFICQGQIRNSMEMHFINKQKK